MFDHCISDTEHYVHGLDNRTTGQDFSVACCNMQRQRAFCIMGKYIHIPKVSWN